MTLFEISKLEPTPQNWLPNPVKDRDSQMMPIVNEQEPRIFLHGKRIHCPPPTARTHGFDKEHRVSPFHLAKAPLTTLKHIEYNVKFFATSTFTPYSSFFYL
jgi:hypothetical protein